MSDMFRRSESKKDIQVSNDGEFVIDFLADVKRLKEGAMEWETLPRSVLDSEAGGEWTRVAFGALRRWLAELPEPERGRRETAGRRVLEAWISGQGWTFAAGEPELSVAEVLELHRRLMEEAGLALSAPAYAQASQRLYAALTATVEALLTEAVRQAQVDALTGAATRRGYEAWLKRLPPGSTGLVMVYDLDDFKWFNDTFGHWAGDTILRQAAARVREVVDERSILVRLGGDEFLLCCLGPDFQSLESCQRFVGALHHRLTHESYRVGRRRYRLGVSAGWLMGPIGEDLVRRADDRLLLAKRQGKNHLVGPQHQMDPPLAPSQARRRRESWPPAAELGWLAEAASALWAGWSTAAVLVNRRGEIVAVNPAYQALVGRGRAELLGQNPRINSAGATPPPIYRGLWARLQKGKTWRGVLENQRADGERWWAEEEIIPIVVGSQVVGYWAAVRDLEAPAPLPPLQSSVTDGTTVQFALQPIVELASGTAIGFEALARPQRGQHPLAPRRWFRLARLLEDEVGADLAALEALARTLSQFGGWPEARRLFVNVKAATLARPARFRRALRALEAAVPRRCLVMEIGERGALRYPHWERLRRTYPGLAWAQDDLGRGDGDLVRMVISRPEWIKLDRELTRRLAQEPLGGPAPALVAALTTWAHRCGTRVVAEGIETEAEFRVARQLGIDAGQGFWLGPPRLIDPPPARESGA
jgi:diguanylate cyclase (GGDEF)-like protein/PAS domain S-box-containing protein